jgi:hypothetical protein
MEENYNGHRIEIVASTFGFSNPIPGYRVFIDGEQNPAVGFRNEKKARQYAENHVDAMVISARNPVDQIDYFMEAAQPGARRNIWRIGRVINGTHYPEFVVYARKSTARSALANLKIQDQQTQKATVKPFWWPHQ